MIDMKRLYRIGETLRGIFLVWRWRKRIACHGAIWCCQRIDRPNDNQRG